MNYIVWLPLKIYTRPFSQEIYSNYSNCSPLELKLTSKKANKEGLYEIIVPAFSPYIKQLLILIDPVHSYLPVKITVIFKDTNPIFDNRKEQWKISEWKNIDNILVPAKWTYQNFTPNGKIIKTTLCKLTFSEINKRIPDTEFKMKMPPGTKVENYVANEHYVIQKDGSKRIYQAGAMNHGNKEYDFKIYKILMNPAYNHLKTIKEIDAVLKKQKAN